MRKFFAISSLHGYGHDVACIHQVRNESGQQNTESKMNEAKIGQAVRIVCGFGNEMSGTISAIKTTRCGTSYAITMEDGSTEFVASFNTKPGIGAFLMTESK